MQRQEPIASHILDEAATWLVQLNASDVSDSDRHAWAEWRARSPEHARAWARAERLQTTLGSVPPSVGMPALGRSRRKAIRHLALLLTAAPAAWLSWRNVPWQEWSADHRTHVGEQKTVQLPDGGSLVLNTQTSLNVRFTQNAREINLVSGEIMIETAPDSAKRPFIVTTYQGTARALGTRFSMRAYPEQTHTTVFSGAVEITPATPGSGKHILQAGEQIRYDRDRVLPLRPAESTQSTWIKGMLVADRMPLGDLIAELSRYRPGILRCDPQVSTLPVSGAFPLLNSDRALSMLQNTYPVRISAATRYWVIVEAR